MPGPADGTYYIFNVGAKANLNLAISYAVPYAPIITWGDQPGATNEQWVVATNASGLTTITSKLGAGNIAFCPINSPGAEIFNGNPYDNSKHELISATGGYKIQVASTDLVWMSVGAQVTDTAENRKVRVARTAVGVNDVWKFTPI